MARTCVQQKIFFKKYFLLKQQAFSKSIKRRKTKDIKTSYFVDTIALLFPKLVANWNIILPPNKYNPYTNDPVFPVTPIITTLSLSVRNSNSISEYIPLTWKAPIRCLRNPLPKSVILEPLVSFGAAVLNGA